MMSTSDNEAMKRRRLGSPGVAPAAVNDVPRRDDAMSRLEQRIDLVEASFQREILEVKRAADLALLNKTSSIESQLSSLQDETDRLKAKVRQLDEENRRLEAAFKLHVRNMDWEYAAPDPPPDSYWIGQGYDYGDDVTTDEDYISDINERFFQRAKNQSMSLRRGAFGLDHVGGGGKMLYFGDASINESPLVRYDVAMWSHWIEFCNAMKTWQFYSVRGTIEGTMPFHVYICNIELPTNVLKKLRECFKPGDIGHVDDFVLDRNEFEGSDGIEFAIKIMKYQKKNEGFQLRQKSC